MHFYRIFKTFRATMPFMKSVIKAYKQTIKEGQTAQPKKPSDSFFSNILSKANLSGPPLTQSVAGQILGVDKNINELDPKKVMQRYYILYQKNDPSKEGTIYLRSKIIEAKKVLMMKFPDGETIEKQFMQQMKKKQQEQKAQENQKSKKQKEQK